MSKRLRWACGAIGLVLAAGAAALAAGGTAATQPAAGDETRCVKCHAMPDGKSGWKSLSRYMGAARCQRCHGGEACGDAYGKWKASKHAKAFDVLGTPPAKAMAAKLSIDDPQTDDRCLRCHVTAFGVPARQLDAKFDRTLGVQCERCHSAAGKHVKNRKPASSQPDALPTEAAIAAEMRRATVATCFSCHGAPEAPPKPFCVNKRWAAIRHADPRWKTAQPHDLPACPCGTEKCVCIKGECPPAPH